VLYTLIMVAPILATKLYVPQPRPGCVSRARLIDGLNAGLARGVKLTLVSASAGFGKTTLVSDWVATCGRPVGWVSLYEGDGAPAQFIAYLIAAGRSNTEISQRLFLALSTVKGHNLRIFQKLQAQNRTDAVP